MFNQSVYFFNFRIIEKTFYLIEKQNEKKNNSTLPTVYHYNSDFQLL